MYSPGGGLEGRGPEPGGGALPSHPLLGPPKPPRTPLLLTLLTSHILHLPPSPT